MFQSIFNTKKEHDLNNKYVLITGAAQGIGFETALQFAAVGCHLILTDIDEVTLAKAKAKIRKKTTKEIHTYTVNVADKVAVQYLASRVYEEVGGVDVLINNAGVGYHGPMEDMSLYTWQKLIDINLWGPLYHIYAFLPMMKKQGRGHIVNVSSGQAFFKLPTWGAYAAIKMAIGAVSEILHYELQKYDINVTTVYPYMVNTGFYNEVEGESLGAKLAMKLLPLYAQKPKTVAQKIFKAVDAGKRVEMVNVLNNVAKGLHFISPVSNLFSKGVNLALNKSKTGEENDTDWEEDVIDPIRAKIQDFTQMLSGMAYASVGELGFRIDETMTGEHEWVNGKTGKQFMEFQVNWGADSLLTWSNPFHEDFMTNYLEGTVTIEGLCEAAPCYGKLELRYFTEQKIRYTFEFEAAGEQYQFIGEKRDIYPWNLPWSHTCCFGELRKAGEPAVLSKSITHFRWKTLPAMLSSFEWLK